MKTRYYQQRLWKISWSVARVGRGLWRVVKFYERRARVGLPWQLVKHAVHHQRIP